MVAEVLAEQDEIPAEAGRMQMPEPITLAAVSAVVLTEGIKFLYGQATEVLKRWREHKKEAEAISVPTVLPSVFEGEPEPFVIHGDAVKALESQLLALRGHLANYAEGLESVDAGDQKLLEAVDALRQVLEAVFRQRLTFRGESRPPSGPVVDGSIDIGRVLGRAAAVEAGRISGGTVTGKSKAGEVAETGMLYGVKADDIGG